MKTIYQIWHVNNDLQDEMLQEFDNLLEANAYVEKLGDRSILATVREIA